MPNAKNPKPLPEDYRRIEGGKRSLEKDMRLAGAVDPNETMRVLLRFKGSAGQAGLQALKHSCDRLETKNTRQTKADIQESYTGTL